MSRWTDAMTTMERAKNDALIRIAELEAERDRLRDQLRQSGQGLAEVVNDKTRLEAERDRALSDYLSQHKDAGDRYLEVHRLEAERDTLSKRVIDCGEKLYQAVAERDKLKAAQSNADSQLIAALQAHAWGECLGYIESARVILSDPSGE